MAWPLGSSRPRAEIHRNRADGDQDRLGEHDVHDGRPDGHYVSGRCAHNRQHGSAISDTHACEQSADRWSRAIQEGAVHKHFLVSGSPTDAMDGYKTALEGSCAWPSKPSNTN